ncbi:MAG: CpaF family protein [Acidobacteria bacterium]|nr:MAG: CpaF family protein [Acidobacteriota bacterium]RLE23508.1 MAG: CpaF family protein [Acidobacteriota bacterium]
MSYVVEVTHSDTGEKQFIAIKSRMIFIGRTGANDVTLDDATVSSRHARVRINEDKVELEDLKSANGIFVNGAKITRTANLKEGEEFQVGPFVLKVLKQTAETVAAGEAAEKATERARKKQEDEAYRYDPFAFVKPFLEPINEFLEADGISEIMINGCDKIYIETGGKIVKTDKQFSSEKALLAAIKNIGRTLGKELNEQNPRLDARLDDGSRVAAVIPPCAMTGTYVSIRKFSKKALGIQDLINFGAITEQAVRFMKLVVVMKKNILVSGGTGSGKTTLLNIISTLIPHDERILVIEDTAELQLQQEHCLRMEAKPADKKGRGQVTIRDLLHSTLRMRPDRIIIGEIRGGEAFDLLQAMNTGHGGSMSTIHANSPKDSLSRLENTTLQSGIELPLKAIRDQISSAINIVVQTARFEDGSRKISYINEVLGLKEDMSYQAQTIYKYERAGKSKDGKVLGHLTYTGNTPTFLDEAIKADFIKSAEELFKE